MEDSTMPTGSSSSTMSLSLIFALLVLVVVLPWVLPFTVVAALVCAVPAAIWWLSASQTNAKSDNATQKDQEDEDLGLPAPPKPGARSGAASRKISVTEPNKQSQHVSAQQHNEQQLQAPAVAAADNAGESVVVLPANSTASKAASKPTGGDAAVPAVAAGSSTAAVPPKAVVAMTPSVALSPAVAAAPAPAAANGVPVAAATEQPVALTGSAAILAKLRSQRQSTSAKAPSTAADGKADGSAASVPARVTVVYASQTGTAQEIARTIHAEAAAAGLAADVMSFNELGFDNLSAAKTPLVVCVASSTGDGDPPDNAAAALLALKKSWPSNRLAGVKFTVLGLGDSNYTRFMHVPRAIKSRFTELGATCFYGCVEADEVDGLEATVDPWCEGIIQPLKAALQELQQPQPASSTTPTAAAAAPRGSTPPAPAAAAAAATAAAAAASSQQLASSLSPEQSTALLAAVMRSNGSDAGDAGSAAGDPRVQMELSGSTAASGALSGQASLLGEESSSSAPAAEASQPDATAAAVAAPEATAAAAPAAAVAAAATAGTPPSTPPVQLMNGLAPKGVDLKGVPPLAPCRIAVNQQLPPSVAAAARQKDAAPTMEQKFYRDPTGAYSAAAPFWATISDARLMTADWSDRTVIHVELDIADSGMRYSAGDAVGVLAQNAAPLVTGLLARLGLDGDSVFDVQSASGESAGQGLLSHVPWPCTLRYAFTNCTDLTSVPRKSLLRMLAEHCSDPDEQRTLLFFTSRAGREAYTTEVAAGQPSVLDLLRRFPSCKPPVDALLDALPPLAPRMYSLTNAPVAAGRVPGACGPNKIQFALSVVEFETQYGTRHGVATNWLARLARPWLAGEVGAGTDPSQLPQVWVPIFLRRAGDFRPPKSLATPMVMIGPGTGVAPFRGFLQQRLADMQAAGGSTPATAVLYFGCRKEAEDYLYQDDWQALQEAGVLQSLRVAFSRAQEAKVYVQHLLKEDANNVAKVVAAGAHVYVCGDGAAMAKDVHAALVGVLRDELGMSEVQAAEELLAMAKAGRYVRDIWS